MKYLLYISFIALLTISCVAKKEIFERTPYEYDNGQKNLYIVDTIRIIDPVVIDTDTGHRFICSQKVFDNYDGKESYFLNHQEVYIHQCIGSTFFPPGIVLKYRISYHDMKVIEPEKKIKGIAGLYKFTEENILFLLVLIEYNYLNRVCTGFDGSPRFDSDGHNYSYYRVVFTTL